MEPGTPDPLPQASAAATAVSSATEHVLERGPMSPAYHQKRIVRNIGCRRIL
jgi:hypothetical protein